MSRRTVAVLITLVTNYSRCIQWSSSVWLAFEFTPVSGVYFTDFSFDRQKLYPNVSVVRKRHALSAFGKPTGSPQGEKETLSVEQLIRSQFGNLILFYCIQTSSLLVGVAKLESPTSCTVESSAAIPLNTKVLCSKFQLRTVLL